MAKIEPEGYTGSLSDLGAEALQKQEEKKEKKETEVTREPTPEEAEDIRAGKKARIAQILVRGIINDKLQAIYDDSVPEEYSGKFVRDTEEDVVRYENLGYGFVYRDGAKGLHGVADNRIRVGDLVLMTIRKEDRELLEEVRLDRIKYKLGEGKREYARRAEGTEDSGIVMTDDSVQQVREGSMSKGGN